jgi:CrcB protein
VLVIVGTGLLGGYTTFSTWMYESRRSYAAINIIVSLVAGLLAVWLGRTVV